MLRKKFDKKKLSSYDKQKSLIGEKIMELSFAEVFKTIILRVVEGLTEWLPIAQDT